LEGDIPGYIATFDDVDDQLPLIWHVSIDHPCHIGDEMLYQVV